jgi:hypothetical protein
MTNIRYFYENKDGNLKQNELTIVQVENGDKKKFENTLSMDYKLKHRIVVLDMKIKE